MSLAHWINRLATWVMPPHRRVWSEAMAAEEAQQDGPASLMWSLGCLKAAWMQRVDAVEDGKALLLAQRLIALFCIAFSLYSLHLLVRRWFYPALPNTRPPSLSLEMQVASFAQAMSCLLMLVCGGLSFVRRLPIVFRLSGRLLLAATIAALTWFEFRNLAYVLTHNPFLWEVGGMTLWGIVGTTVRDLVFLACALALATGARRAFWPLVMLSTVATPVTLTIVLLDPFHGRDPHPLLQALAIHLIPYATPLLLIWLGAGLLWRGPAVATPTA